MILSFIRDLADVNEWKFMLIPLIENKKNPKTFSDTCTLKIAVVNTELNKMDLPGMT